MSVLPARLFSLLRRRAAAYGQRKLRAALPGLLWWMPPFSAAFALRHPKRAFWVFLFCRSAQLSWRLLLRALKK